MHGSCSHINRWQHWCHSSLESLNLCMASRHTSHVITRETLEGIPSMSRLHTLVWPQLTSASTAAALLSISCLRKLHFILCFAHCDRHHNHIGSETRAATSTPEGCINFHCHCPICPCHDELFQTMVTHLSTSRITQLGICFETSAPDAELDTCVHNFLHAAKHVTHVTLQATQRTRTNIQLERTCAHLAERRDTQCDQQCDVPLHELQCSIVAFSDVSPARHARHTMVSHPC